MVAKTCPACGGSYENADFVACPRDGATLRTDQADGLDPVVGEVVAARYRITGLVGRGGMGTVYAAEHLTMRRSVALKLLRPELSADAAMIGRFKREAQAAARIVSPHVVMLHDFGETERGQLFIVMELLEGESLASRLARKGALAVGDALRVASEIAQAIAAAHAAGVVHRDLKPDNVFLVGPAAQVKVLDFGIAKIADTHPQTAGDSQLTQAGTIVGTPMYMSPEAVARREVGPAADLYALGVILFELLVGRVPFDDPEPVLLMGMHLRVPAELLREARPDLRVTDEIERLVDELLAKDPLERPSSADAVVRRLVAPLDLDAPSERTQVDAAAAGLVDEGSRRTTGALPAAVQTPLATSAPSPGVSRAASRAPWWLAAAGALAIAVIAMGASVWWALRSNDRNDTRERATTAASSSPAMPTAPSTVEIRISVTPADAIVRVDGSPIALPVHRLARDGRTHRIEVAAPGHQGRTMDVVGDRDQAITVDLAPVLQAEPASPRRTVKRDRVRAARSSSSPSTRPTSTQPAHPPPIRSEPAAATRRPRRDIIVDYPR